jgi:hypothetical protein
MKRTRHSCIWMWLASLAAGATLLQATSCQAQLGQLAAEVTTSLLTQRANDLINQVVYGMLGVEAPFSFSGLL